jgi:hypothetical protein
VDALAELHSRPRTNYGDTVACGSDIARFIDLLEFRRIFEPSVDKNARQQFGGRIDQERQALSEAIRTMANRLERQDLFFDRCLPHGYRRRLYDARSAPAEIAARRAARGIPRISAAEAL